MMGQGFIYSTVGKVENWEASMAVQKQNLRKQKELNQFMKTV